MKKILLLVLSLMLFVVPGLAEDVSTDLSTMSVDDLIALRKCVDNELDSRDFFSESEIYSGTYVVGKDIKLGSYVIVCAQTMSQYGLEVRLYADEEMWRDSESLSRRYIDEGESLQIRLDEGMVVALFDGTATIRRTEPSWAP